MVAWWERYFAGFVTTDATCVTPCNTPTPATPMALQDTHVDQMQDPDLDTREAFLAMGGNADGTGEVATDALSTALTRFASLVGPGATGDTRGTRGPEEMFKIKVALMDQKCERHTKQDASDLLRHLRRLLKEEASRHPETNRLFWFEHLA